MNLDRDALDRLDPVQANVIAIIQAMLELQTPATDVQQTLEPGLSVEACIVAAAALLETSGERDLEQRITRACERLSVHARSFRREHEASGEGALQQLGACSVTRHRIQ